MSGLLEKKHTKIAFAHFVWHFVVGKPWDSTTTIAKGVLIANTCARPHSNLHDNDSTTIIDKKTLFGVHAQVSYVYIYIYEYTSIYVYIHVVTIYYWRTTADI